MGEIIPFPVWIIFQLGPKLQSSVKVLAQSRSLYSLWYPPSPIDVKMNFKKKYKEDMTCRLCSTAEEFQLHLLNCKVILSDVNIKKALKGFTYSDTFSTNLETQTHMILTWQKVMRLRVSKLRNNHEDSSSQALPEDSGASYSYVRHWI